MATVTITISDEPGGVAVSARADPPIGDELSAAQAAGVTAAVALQHVAGRMIVAHVAAAIRADGTSEWRNLISS